MAPAVSVVVPTHNRRDSVLRLLAALERQPRAADTLEAVVVADGCTDDTVAALHGVAFSFPVRVLEQFPGRGAAAARNLGAAHATGALLVFLDDDIEPGPTLVEAHLEAHRRERRDRAARVVVGACRPARSVRPDLFQTTLWAWWDDQFYEMSRPGHRFSYQDLFTGNCSLPAALFARLGGFDATLPESCRDDFELGVRAVDAGAEITFAPDAAAVHHDATDLDRWYRRARAEGHADVSLARRHPALVRTLQLSHVGHRPTSVFGMLCWLAFRWPAAGDLIAALARALLRPLESLRLRRSWRRLSIAGKVYWYWRGVAAGVGTRQALGSLLAAAIGAGISDREIDVDLSAGMGAAERLVDVERPSGARLFYGDQPVGRIPPRPGAEPLRGIHVRRALATDLSHQLLLALAVEGTIPMIAGVAPENRRTVAGRSRASRAERAAWDGLAASPNVPTDLRA
ncbi:MAG: glycosyltransferase [Gemmatimonadaceae bacterium]